MNSGVYVIENTATGKVYVGSAVDFSRRQRQHFGDLRRGAHRSQRLQHSFNKHGEPAFKWWVAEECDPSRLIEREQWWLDMFEPWDDAKGYNISPTAASSLGIKRRAETIEKVRIGCTGKKYPNRKRPPPITEAHRASLRGRPVHKHSAGTRARMSAAKRGVLPDAFRRTCRNAYPDFGPEILDSMRSERVSGASLDALAKKYGASRYHVTLYLEGVPNG